MTSLVSIQPGDIVYVAGARHCWEHLVLMISPDRPNALVEYIPTGERFETAKENLTPKEAQ